MALPSVSVIIPAHNEGGVISKTLEALDFGDTGDDDEIIVVCNACTDDTVDQVRLFKHVKLIESDIASKTAALNLGDEIATGSIRIYMDADVVISASDIQLLVDEIVSKEFLAVTPNIRMDLRNTSWLVRAYYDIWLRLPYVMEGFMGSGVYALSPAGRQRFDLFPNVISDDGYVRGQFVAGEISRVNDAISYVTAPKSISGLLKIKTRSRLGNYELIMKYPEMNLGDRRKSLLEVIGILVRPANILKSFVYIGINLICRIRAKSILSSGQSYVWETDKSSRNR